ncbi:CBS domain-containing protein [Fibrivirga algicola]|uniref:CBS domain-containing protein n=1 Tax=Fibrivirga algicola TaxID=2950420 RepID=A0ABX0QK11_9BACT|nr:CBS domain-containing protein [Fibrivirga algicola]ARK12399.1 histidine kinase [Fibrella sp. ES10-3-2-2]NID12466.1 CBS domain-containing protein [Fibrivirga algicola]
MNIRQVLQRKTINTIYSVAPGETVYAALELMAAKNIGAVLVIEGGDLVGIFSERDYARKGILQGRASKDTTIRDVMTANVITITPEQSLESCMVTMADKHIRHLPVMDGEKLVGIISINDVVNTIIHDQKARINSLESYITGSSY